MQDLIQSAIDHHKSGSLVKAERIYGHILQDDPKDAYVYYLLGAARYQMKRWDSAIEVLQKSLELHPDYPSALCCLGHTQRALCRFDEAATSYLRATNLQPTHLEAWVGLAKVHLKRSDYDAALEAAEAAGKISADDPGALIATGEIHGEKGDPDKALHYYNRCLEIAPHQPYCHIHLGKLYMEQEKFDWASDSFTRAIRLSNELMEPYMYLGDIYMRTKEYKKAEEHYRQAFHLDPGNPEISLRLGKFFELHNRTAEAFAFFDHCVKSNPQCVEAQWKTGNLLFTHPHTKGRAEPYFRKAVELDDQCFEGYCGLAELRFQTNNHYAYCEEAHKHFKPVTYVEIGVGRGQSMKCALPPTLCIGIDPAPEVMYSFNTYTRIFEMTSDAFFEKCDLISELGGRRVEMAFIDGLHQFEQVLKNFINIEKNASSDSLIFLYDCLPLDDITSSRERKTKFWTGDSWKVIPCLRRYRPDLKIISMPIYPAGLAVVTNLDPDSGVLKEMFDQATREFIPLNFSDVRDVENVFNIVEDDWPSICNRIEQIRPAASPYPFAKGGAAQ